MECIVSIRLRTVLFPYRVSYGITFFECGIDWLLVIDMTLYLYQIRLVIIGAQNLHVLVHLGRWSFRNVQLW